MRSTLRRSALLLRQMVAPTTERLQIRQYRPAPGLPVVRCRHGYTLSQKLANKGSDIWHKNFVT